MALRKNDPRSKPRQLDDWFRNKPLAKTLFNHFYEEYRKIGDVTVRSAKTMIIITTPRKGIAYLVPGSSFLHVVLPFGKPHNDNLCFQKIAQVPSQKQFNHHLRIYSADDLNAEVKKFMKLAYEEGI